MTDLLSPLTTRRSSTDAADRRPLALSAALAGLAAPAIVLASLWAVGLVGWYAADGGTHGTTRSVLRVAADGWLLAHGAHLETGAVTLSASPLGLTLVCLFVTYRCGRRAGARAGPTGLRAVGQAAVVLGGVYGVLTLVTALLASAPQARPGLGLAFLGGAFVGGLAGGLGLLRGVGEGASLRRLVPVPVLSVGYGALAAVLCMAAAGALVTAVALALHIDAAANVAEQLDLDLTGGIFSLLLLLAILPNLVLLAATYLLGSGFAVGVGTVVSPGDVTLGAVPSVPVLAALPADGWTPGWAMAFLAVPVIVGAAAAFTAGRTLPTGSYQTGAARGFGAGVLGSLLLAVAVSWAGGGIGPGRMTELGAAFWPTFLAGLLPLGLGGAVGGMLATWRTRRHDVADAAHPVQGTAPHQPRPLAGPEDDTEAVHLPPVTAKPLLPSHDDLSTEDTVHLRLPPSR